MKSDSESTISHADISPEQALDKLISPEHEPILEGVRCPQCAEKDAEIAKLKLAESNLVSELAWIKSERPAIAKTERDLREEIEIKNVEIQMLASEIVDYKRARVAQNDYLAKMQKERDELKTKLEKAKETLKSIRDALRGNERSPYVVAKEALKEIGE